MSKDNFFQKIIRLWVGGRQKSQRKAASRHNSSMMSKLLQMVENTDEVEIACDEVYEILDQYVELEARGEDVASLLPLVKRHLDKCRDCHEEYEALVRVFEATSS
jgi:dissimilatory sulfite reductase (desulfoviridin) alpha/beta subunit